MFDLKSDARRLLEGLDQAIMSSTAYDTAWLAHVPDGNSSSAPAFPQALDWLRQNQHPDGSWGAEIVYYHDRIISSLAAIIALAQHGDPWQDAELIRRGESYIRKNMKFLHNDHHETVGFELIFPTLLQKAQPLGLNLPYTMLDKYERIREEKLRPIPRHLIYSRQVTTAHSLEFMGSELDVNQIGDLQEENGSCGNSPSATAYLLVMCKDNPAAQRYLTEVTDVSGGTAMPLFPVEIFNKSWALYNLDLAGFFVELEEEIKPHLDALYQAWDHRRGIGFSRQYSVPDLDDTAVVFKLLYRAGYDVDPDVFTTYERNDHFMCFPYERNLSLGVHIHLLDALRVCPDYEHRPRMVSKILDFLRRTRLDGTFWLDKWHVSPYYITSHAVVATIGYDDELAREAVNWMIGTQRKDGSWGHFRSTGEETAYCLQALTSYHRQVEPLDGAAISRAAQYLYHRYQSQKNDPALWIDKCLYTPLQIVRSTILSALQMYEAL
jgi:halimadienyl-diphosphate synthase